MLIPHVHTMLGVHLLPNSAAMFDVIPLNVRHFTNKPIIATQNSSHTGLRKQ
jgi:hypothetical protein